MHHVWTEVLEEPCIVTGPRRDAEAVSHDARRNRGEVSYSQLRRAWQRGQASEMLTCDGPGAHEQRPHRSTSNPALTTPRSIEPTPCGPPRPNVMNAQSLEAAPRSMAAGRWGVALGIRGDRRLDRG